jgi:hypothetical protein
MNPNQNLVHQKPGAPSIPRPPAEWVGNHEPEPASPQPNAVKPATPKRAAPKKAARKKSTSPRKRTARP